MTKRKKTIPTDLKILQAIYDQHFDEYAGFEPAKPNRGDKLYVPIDIAKIASKLDTDGDIIFGRLYYVLERKICLHSGRWFRSSLLRVCPSQWSGTGKRFFRRKRAR